jgi:putative nucleotidyltransferase with HDIG domain
MTGEKPLVAVINDYLATKTLDVPVFHAVALRVQQILAKPQFTIDEVTLAIVADQALTSQVLRVANSSFYAGLNKVANIKDAIIRLGAQEVANIAMMATQLELHRTSRRDFDPFIKSLWKHALACAVGSKWLAKKIGYDYLAQEAFLAGLLHDIGKLYLLKVIEEISSAGQYQVRFSPALIMEVLVSMHVEQGFQLMQQWNLPEAYSEVVRDHHTDEWAQGNTLLTVVRLVNKACHKLGIGLIHEPDLVLFTTHEVQILGLKEIALAELEIVLEDTIQKTL